MALKDDRFRLGAARTMLASVVGLTAAIALPPGCSTTVDDPKGVLQKSDALPSSQEKALVQLQGDTSPEYIKLLRRIVTQPGYTPPVREQAFLQLREKDPAALREALAIAMPRMDMLEWRTRLCELIVENTMTEMTPTLINAWAYPMGGWIRNDEERPEYIALAALHGKEQVPDVLYQAMLESNPVTQANLRARCWELLWKTGNRERLVALVQNDKVEPDDAFLADLRASARDLGILPRNREEILWLRSLREPKRSAFWRDAMTATKQMPPDVRAQLELRELPVAVAAMHIDPKLLAQTPEALYPQLESRIKSEGRRTHTPSFQGYSGEFTESLYQLRDQLKWGDYASMLMACSMLEQPRVLQHLFDVADRDVMDRSTEFGGVIEVDPAGRFSIREFRPKVTGSDVRFEAPQEMFDLAYTSLFHFHNHAQAYNNVQYAGPHMGDFAYAESTRANCLVFTFIDKSTLNADFYRYGRVVIDLGTFTRPGATSASGSGG